MAKKFNMTPEERKMYTRRQLTIYAPSEEALARWKERARAVDMPVTKFVVECVEAAMVEEKTPAKGDSDVIALLKRELDKKDKEFKLNLANIRINQDKPEIDPIELKNLTRDVLNAMKQGGVWKLARLLLVLNLGIDKVSIVSRAVTDMADLGVIEETDNGWRYKR
jgi:hypothetical protein